MTLRCSQAVGQNAISYSTQYIWCTHHRAVKHQHINPHKSQSKSSWCCSVDICQRNYYHVVTRRRDCTTTRILLLSTHIVSVQGCQPCTLTMGTTRWPCWTVKATGGGPKAVPLHRPHQTWLSHALQSRYRNHELGVNFVHCLFSLRLYIEQPPC